jgi:hypothetical protein
MDDEIRGDERLGVHPGEGERINAGGGRTDSDCGRDGYGGVTDNCEFA